MSYHILRELPDNLYAKMMIAEDNNLQVIMAA